MGPAIGTTVLSLALVFGSVAYYDVPVQSGPILLTSGDGDDPGGGGGGDTAGGGGDTGGGGANQTSGGGDETGDPGDNTGGDNTGGDTGGEQNTGGDDGGLGTGDNGAETPPAGDIGTEPPPAGDIGTEPPPATGPVDPVEGGTVTPPVSGPVDVPPPAEAPTGGAPVGTGGDIGTGAPVGGGEPITGGAAPSAPPTGPPVPESGGASVNSTLAPETVPPPAQNTSVVPGVVLPTLKSLVPLDELAPVNSNKVQVTEEQGPLGGFFGMLGGLFGGGGPSGSESKGPLKGFADAVGDLFTGGATSGESKSPLKEIADAVGGIFSGGVNGGETKSPLQGVADLVGGVFGGGGVTAAVEQNPVQGITDFLGGLLNGGEPLDFTLFNRGFGISGSQLDFGPDNEAYSLIPEGSTGLQAVIDILGLLGAVFTQADEMCAESVECTGRLEDTAERQAGMPSWDSSGVPDGVGQFIDERDIGLVRSDFFSESFGAQPFQTAVEMIAGGPVPGLGILSALDSFLSQEDQSWAFTKGTPLRTFIQEPDTRQHYVDNIVWSLQGLVGLFIPVV